MDAASLRNQIVRRASVSSFYFADWARYFAGFRFYTRFDAERNSQAEPVSAAV